MASFLVFLYLFGKWYLNYVDNIHRDYGYSIEFKEDHTFIEDYSCYQEYSENSEEPFIATGTWSLNSGKLHLKYTDGNSNEDEEEIVDVSLINDSLVFTFKIELEDSTETWTSVYKKTKNSY